MVHLQDIDTEPTGSFLDALATVALSKRTKRSPPPFALIGLIISGNTKIPQETAEHFYTVWHRLETLFELCSRKRHGEDRDDSLLMHSASPVGDGSHRALKYGQISKVFRKILVLTLEGHV